MKFTTLLTASFAFLTIASPVDVEKRQLSNLLSSLAGSGTQTFDYVVVGGGTAGLTIARRLAEDGSVSVAVIEAGTLYQFSSPEIINAPGGDTAFIGTKESFPVIDWGFYTAPDPATKNITRAYARGKCLGGSSARNFMIYQRPTVGSLQQWAEAVQDNSYNFDNFLPFFKKSSKFTPPHPDRPANASATYSPSAFEASGGPLSVSYAIRPQVLSSYMQGGLNAIGIPTIEDFNTGSLLGCSYCTSTIDSTQQTRESSQTAYLKNKPNNLKVFPLTLAKKILFDSKKKATGVIVESASISYTVKARKEIILSAGAFQSPQLLLVSGVGDAKLLRSLNIPVVADRPGVGQNLQDHILFGPSYRVNFLTFTRLANDPTFLAAQYAEYQATETGPLTSPGSDFLGWEKVPADLRPTLGTEAINDLAQLPADWPEIEYLTTSAYIGNFESVFFGQPRDGYQYATILAALVAPRSRGNVTITSADARLPPIINAAALQSNSDQKVAIAAYKRMRQAWASPAMQKAVIGEEAWPGKKVKTDAQILDTIKGSIQTVWHASSTCKMGTPSDTLAVVDKNAKVYGVSGLRVVDASSFPFLPPGHPQSVVYALAEKIADDIKNGR